MAEGSLTFSDSGILIARIPHLMGTGVVFTTMRVILSFGIAPCSLDTEAPQPVQLFGAGSSLHPSPVVVGPSHQDRRP